MKLSFVLLSLFLLGGAAAAAGNKEPVEDFFKEPVFAGIRVSPDGQKLAALATWKKHLNLFIIDMKTKVPTLVTGLTTVDVSRVRWIGNNRLIFHTTDDGYDSGGLFAIDADGSNPTALSQSIKQQGKQGHYTYRYASFLDFYGQSIDEILVVSNEMDELNPDVFIMNVRTGVKRMAAKNPGNVRAWVADGTGAVRAGFGEQGREQFIIYRDDATGPFRELKRWDFESGSIEPMGFDQDNRHLYVRTSEGRDRAVIALFDPATGSEVKELFADPVYDAGGVVLSRIDHRLLGYTCERDKPTVEWTDKRMQILQTLIDREFPATSNVFMSESDDQKWMVVLAHSDRDPGTYYMLDTEKPSLEQLVVTRPWIKPAAMAEMRPISYQARDGLTIHGYLSVPAGSDGKNLPLIVNPHGGPWVRDGWGFNPEIQFLANRGYAVLQMNFRGSTGYGRKLLQAGYGQWGLAMQDDITDGVKWAIEQGIADPRHIAIYGASYGGYATMAGLAFTPELYCCGINYVGVTDIALLLKTIPKAWESTRASLEAMTGNAKRDRQRLQETSPMDHVANIKVPVLFAYGERDDRVDLKHGTRMVKALRANRVPVTLIVKADEGHGFYRWDNKISLYQSMEEFLGKYLAK